MNAFAQDGFLRLRFDLRVAAWAKAAHEAALQVVRTPGDVRHGGTWRVGVDELPNAADGSIFGVALRGPWDAYVTAPVTWHRGQLSVVYPGYPQQDADESDAQHRFRLARDAAHVDGLLPEGPDKRRYLREPHRFILGLPLNVSDASPLVVWKGSHHVMRAAFQNALDHIDPAAWADVDLTEIYTTARRKVFDTCQRIAVPATPGEATLVHRHTVHGVAPWNSGSAPPEGRMIAYFRPVVTDVSEWL